MLLSTNIRAVYDRDLDKDFHNFTVEDVHIVDGYPALVEDHLHVALYVVFPGMEDSYPFVPRTELLQVVTDRKAFIQQQCNATIIEIEDVIKRDEEKDDKELYIVIGAALGGLGVIFFCIAGFICK